MKLNDIESRLKEMAIKQGADEFWANAAISRILPMLETNWYVAIDLSRVTVVIKNSLVIRLAFSAKLDILYEDRQTSGRFVYSFTNYSHSVKIKIG